MTSAGAPLWEPLGGALPSCTAGLHRTVPMTVMHRVGGTGSPSHTGVILGFGCRFAMFNRGTRPPNHGIVQVFEGTWSLIPALSLASFALSMRFISGFIMLVSSLSCVLLRSTMRQ